MNGGLFIGLMSGTSADGIDAVLVQSDGERSTLLATQHRPMPQQLREEILAFRHPGNNELHRLATLDAQLADEYAAATAALLQAARISAEGVTAIGQHGQTLRHHPEGTPPYTLQIGDPNRLAELTGISVVADFRRRDMAAGGQGAPLVPFVDYLLFRHPKKIRVLLNIGGIANVTILPAGAAPEQVVAFDTGPGNMVIDQLAWIISRGKRNYDRNGAFARKGKPNAQLLQSLLRNPYYQAKPPKSCGREQFGREFIAHLLATQIDLHDLIATVTLLTPVTIYEAIKDLNPDELIAAGGGTNNPQIMNHLRGLLPATKVQTTDDYGLPAEAKEAVAFAILARETWLRRPGNLPSATGARRPVILGQITPA